MYKQKAHSIYKKIEKYNAELEIKQENVPKEDDGIYDDEEEFADEEVEDEEEFEDDEEEVTDDGEDERKPVASGQSTEDTHQRIVKTLQKKAPGAVYNTVVDEESATKHDTSDGIIIMSGTAYGGGTIIPGQRKEDEKLGKQQMMDKFLESAVNDDQSLPYGPNHWTKDDPTEARSDSRSWRRRNKTQPQPQPTLRPQWQEPPQPTRVTSYPYQGEMNSHPYGNGHGHYPPSHQREGSNRSYGTHPQNYHHINQRLPGRDAQSLLW